MKYEFTLEESQTILNALTKEPYGAVVNVINKFQGQAKEQMTEKPQFGVPVPKSEKAV